jgi:mono/diheme cytochrome c family protein
MWTLVLPTTLMLMIPVMTHARGAIDRAGLDSGRTLFLTYCASCHGDGGRGNGPVATELRHRPADVTQLARRDGGVFNGPRIRRLIDGRGVTAHGTMEMPVWGDVFKLREGLTAGEIAARVDALVQYLENLQERAGH